MLRNHLHETLGNVNLRELVHLPEGEDLQEWIAYHVVEFYNQINLLYGTITEYCTPDRCKVMSAGPRYEYHWCDGNRFKKPVKVCTSQPLVA